MKLILSLIFAACFVISTQAAQNVKTINGVAIANVKTVNGVAIASVKTVDGVDNTGGGGTTPPTFIQTASSPSWSSNSALTTNSFSVQIGDVLVLGIITDNFDASTPTVTNSGTSLSWAAKSVVQVINNCSVYTYTTTCTAAETITVGANLLGLTGTWGMEVSTWRGSGGIGATNSTNGSGAPSLALTTTTNNSVIVMFDGDWAAGTGASRTYRTINSITPTPGGTGELFYDAAGVGSTYVVYGAYWSNAGTAGSKTTGMTAPTQTYAIASIEVKGL